MAKFKLTDLEKAAILEKANLADSLLTAKEIHLQEVDSTFDPQKALGKEVIFDNDNGKSVAYRRWWRISLSGKEFIVMETVTEWHEISHSRANRDSSGTDVRFYVFQSEGEDIDAARVNAQKLEKLFKGALEHLPEAMEMLREEYSKYICEACGNILPSPTKPCPKCGVNRMDMG